MSYKIKSNFHYGENLSLSQNFMTDSRLLHRIVNRSNISDRDKVMEIGTGKGHLTRILCKKAGFVTSIEMDKKLYEIARNKLSDCSNLRLIQGDFLQYSLPVKGAYKVFSNIPYFISSQIIDKLTKHPNKPEDIWIVVEKGFAKRLMGIPAESKKSLLLKVHWHINTVYHFQKEDFHPKPSVDSVLLHLSKKACPDIDPGAFTVFEQFVNDSMQYGILHNRSLLTRKQVRTALKLAHLPALTKNERPDYAQWICLFKCFQKFNTK